MTRAEYKKVLEIIRDNRDNLIEVAIGLNEMVEEDPGEESDEAAVSSKEKTISKAAGHKRVFKPKNCIVCGRVFQPKNGRQKRCNDCATMTIEEDTRNTAAELAAMMR